MKIGIDIDDTIANTFEVLFAYSQEFNGTILNNSYKPKKVRKNFKKQYFQELYNWNEQEKNRFFNMYYDKALKEVRPKTLAAETINKIKEDGNEIYIITSRYAEKGKDIFKITTEWLKQYNIKYDKLIINEKSKKMSISENEIDFYIDDDYKVCKECKKLCKVFLMDMEANKSINLKQITRVYSWPHILKEIENVKNT